MAKSTLSTLITLLLTATTLAAPRRHAVQPPAGWTPSAFSTTESNGDVSDLAPIGPLVGDATLIGLGDGTHGTHEYFATKRRIIEYLVRNKDFDEVDFEGEFLHFAKIDAYINGAPGDAKQLVLSPPDIYYFFWEVQELADVVEWMRDYNLHRVPGVRAIHVGGADIYGVVEAAVDATKYLDRVDPAAADNARAASGCVSLTMPQQCELGFAAIRDAALAHEAAYVASTSQREFDDAVHAMDLVAN